MVPPECIKSPFTLKLCPAKSIVLAFIYRFPFTISSSFNVQFLFDTIKPGSSFPLFIMVFTLILSQKLNLSAGTLTSSIFIYELPVANFISCIPTSPLIITLCVPVGAKLSELSYFICSKLPFSSNVPADKLLPVEYLNSVIKSPFTKT